jgi:hypothetical protein
MAGKGKTTPLGNREGRTWPAMITRSERSATNFHIYVIVEKKRGGIGTAGHVIRVTDEQE